MHFPFRLRRILASILVRQALLVIVPLLLILAGTLWGGLRTLDAAITQNVRSSVGKTALILNMSVSAYIGAGDQETLALFFSEMLNGTDSTGLVYVIVGRENGQVLIDSREGKQPVPPPDPPETWEHRALGGMVHVRNPLLLTGREVGFLQFGVSTTEMVEAIRTEQRKSLLFSGAIAALTLLSSVLLGWRLTRRLAALIAASKAVSGGDYERRLEVRGDDELAQLADDFNRMAEAVQTKIDEITALNQMLEQRVEARTEELAAANRQLQDNLRQLSDAKDLIVRSEKLAGLGALVAGIAHELNTPIGNATTVGSTMLDDAEQLDARFKAGNLRRSDMEEFAERFRRGGEILARNLTRASELISSFKTVAVDRTSEQRRPFNLKQTLGELITALQPSLKRTPFTLEESVPDSIEFNSYPGPLNQAITNLVNNGIAHAFEGREKGRMEISARIDPDNTGWVMLDFSDDGVGIAPEHLGHIFDPFFTTKLGRGGSGLGLNITHNIVEGVLGGSLRVHSVHGKGTTFHLRLPLQAPLSETTDAP
jgi:signal transduction histidine kinase